MVLPQFGQMFWSHNSSGLACTDSDKVLETASCNHSILPRHDGSERGGRVALNQGLSVLDSTRSASSRNPLEERALSENQPLACTRQSDSPRERSRGLRS